jgi:hypothetical protein
MRVASLIIAVIGIASIALGVYICVTGSRPAKPAPSAESGPQAVTAEDLETLKARADSRFKKLEVRVEELETIAVRLQKEIASLKGSLQAKSARPQETQPTQPTPQSDSSASPLREEVERGTDERDRERRERMSGGFVQQFVEYTQRRIERIADTRSWDAEKRQSVMAILAEHQGEIEKVIEAWRQEDQDSPEARDAMIEKIRSISSGTVEKLRSILAPEELQEVQRILEPSRRTREPWPAEPPSGKSTPAQPEPGQ